MRTDRQILAAVAKNQALTAEEQSRYEELQADLRGGDDNVPPATPSSGQAERKSVVIDAVAPDPLIRTSKAGKEYRMFKFYIAGEDFARYTFTDMNKIPANATVNITPVVDEEGNVVKTQKGIPVVNVEVLRQPVREMSAEEKLKFIIDNGGVFKL